MYCKRRSTCYVPIILYTIILFIMGCFLIIDYNVWVHIQVSIMNKKKSNVESKIGRYNEIITVHITKHQRSDDIHL